MITIMHIDHLVLTVKRIPTTLGFYVRILGMRAIQFGDNRIALKFGQQKINLHEVGNTFEPKVGTVDLCLTTDTELTQAIHYVRNCNVEIIEDPVERTGATGQLLSFFIRDSDQNLIETANQC